MPLFPIKIPPGIVRQGTEYGSKGRYYDGYLIRWSDDGTLKPVGGWRLRSTDSDNVVTGAARALLPWKDNNGLSWLGIGTHSGLFVQNRAGQVFDITPDDFIAGRPDAVAVGGYGDGDYDEGSYGTPRPDVAAVQNATQWALDTWGEDLVGVSPDDGVMYQWQLDPDTRAAPISGGDTPPTCKALVVTPEGFLFALGSNDPRTVSWCDQRDNTVWLADATNQAGDFSLQTQGSLLCGKVIKGGTLLFTDLDVHLAVYIGGTSVYSFDKVGTACGPVSRQSVAVVDAQAVWLSKSGFWIFNGYVQPLPCDVLDYITGDFNTLQASKTYAVRDSANSEIQFYYCSDSSTEIDRCVVWNYKFNYWNIGRVPRLCGADRGVFTYPVYVDADGRIFEHEVGFDYDGVTPFAEGGPIELGEGDQVLRGQYLIPDEKTSGQVTATFKGKFEPNAVTEYTFGPYSLSSRTDVRFETRQVNVRYDGAVLADWRVGTPRLDAVAGGRR